MTHSKLATLQQAIKKHVLPCDHLHFASTPSRSNAAIREVARQFRGTDPRFIISTTGFHSTAHLLPMLGLGQRYIGCFFGDNYPTPKANSLYAKVAEHGGCLEHWSLGSYVAALRAGALGHDYAITKSLKGSSIAQELAAAGKYLSFCHFKDDAQLGMVAAISPDIAFFHASFGHESGATLFSPPYSEGFYGALAANKGVIVTVEQEADLATMQAFAAAQKIPPERVLAICVVPFGAHPQPHFALPEFAAHTYPDDFEHYEHWRKLSNAPELLAKFDAEVLQAPELTAQAAYQNFVQCTRSAIAPRPPQVARARSNEPLSREDCLVIMAARTIAKRLQAGGLRHILAGIGQGFMATRMAKLWLDDENYSAVAMVETGLFDIECGPAANDFLLSFEHMAQCRRLSDVEDILLNTVGGANNRCLGVLGAAQVDPFGNLNSTRLANGRMLVGSGGANDIASTAHEVVVVLPWHTERLVPKVDYITSPGRAVRCIVTDRCVLIRDDTHCPTWTIAEIWPEPHTTPEQTIAWLHENSGWPIESFKPTDTPRQHTAATASELDLLAQLRRANHPAKELQ